MAPWMESKSWGCYIQIRLLSTAFIYHVRTVGYKAQEGTWGKEKALSNWIHSAVALVWKIGWGHKRDKTMTNTGKRRDRIREQEQLLLCMAAPKPFEWRNKMKTRAASGYQAKTHVVVVTERQTFHSGGGYWLLSKSAHDDDEDLWSKKNCQKHHIVISA